MQVELIQRSTLVDQPIPVPGFEAMSVLPALPAPAAPTAPHSPSLVAKLGFELEIGSARVHPFVPKGTILIEGDGWNLETDKYPNKDMADLEFVVAPHANWADIQSALLAITGLIQAIRDKALAHPRKLVSLAELAGPDKPFRIRAAYWNSRIQLTNPHFRTRLQATYGVGLPRMDEYLQQILSKAKYARILAATRRVDHYFLARYGTPLRCGSRGFVQLINYFLSCTRGPAVQKDATVHIYFRMMPRSDFCAMFDKLLDDTERAQIEALFLAPAANEVPPFLEALGLKGDVLVFREPYFSKKYERVAGPTLVAWLASIVQGRGEGPLRKDLMSPPPGYPLHSGNIDADYGFGAMGVDETNQLALFEIRHAPHRQDMPLNTHILQAALREYADAKRQNDSMARMEELSCLGAPDFADTRAREAALTALENVRSCITKLSNGSAKKHWKELLELRLPGAQASLDKLDQQTQGSRSRPLAEDVALNMAGIFIKQLKTCSEPAQTTAILPVYSEIVSRCEQLLWNAQLPHAQGSNPAA